MRAGIFRGGWFLWLLGWRLRRYRFAEVVEHHGWADQIWPMGLAMLLWPAMSGAEPWIGLEAGGGRDGRGLMLPDGAMPMVPVQAGPRSERMSPKRLEATTTSKR